MALSEKRQPYEFLARWDENGKFKGAHVQFQTVITDDATGEVKLQTPGKVMPIGEGIPNGFPIADILGQLHVDAVKATDAAVSAKAVAEQVATEAQTKATEIQSALDGAFTLLKDVKAKFAPKVP